MNGLSKVFNYENQQVRTVMKAGEPWFVAKDVCEILDLQNSRDAMARLDDDEKGVGSTDTLGGNQQMLVVSESGLYTLVLGSRKPEAKSFKRWITHEVIPSIRKHGMYATTQTLEDMICSPEFGMRLLSEIKAEREKRLVLEAKVVEQAPKVLFAESVQVSNDCILIGNLAKLIKQNGFDTGEKRLFQWLRDNEYLIKSGQRKNSPTQKSMDLGLFEVKEFVQNFPDKEPKIRFTTKVTGKGQVYFINKFLKIKESLQVSL